MLWKTMHNINGLDAIDAHFGRFIAELGNKSASNLAVAVAAALAHHSISQGHICCDLRDYAGTSLSDAEGAVVFECPAYKSWCETLVNSGVVGKAGCEQPLIMDDNGYLYLYQYYQYQQKIKLFIEKFSSISLNKNHFETAEILKRLFKQFKPAIDFNDPDQRQMLAALNCAVNPFCVISGGPGTGKTTTIARILALLLELKLVRPGHIMLAAPTGKAAARLGEAIARSKTDLAAPPTVLKAIPEEAFTIHRLLTLTPKVDAPKALNVRLTLPADLVLVDEASMADIELLNRLLDVLPPVCRFILVGDHAQLASVGAGSVLSDICGDISRDSVFSEEYAQTLQTVFSGDYQAIARLPSQIKLQQPQDSLVMLTKNYRYKDAERGLSRLAPLIRHGNAKAALALLKDDKDVAVSINSGITSGNLVKNLTPLVQSCYVPVFNAETPAEALEIFDRFRILCAVKEGPLGTQALNAACEHILRKTGAFDGNDGYYHGQPVLVGQNDYRLRLFNGDIGIVWRNETDSALKVYFHDYQNGGLRAFAYYNLPGHETAYAMTVHRSQGSEFDDVLLVLPEKDNRVLSRELVYTGISRAKQAVTIWSGEKIFAEAVTRLMERKSGLRRALNPAITE